jgi:hypothetical protein
LTITITRASLTSSPSLTESSGRRGQIDQHPARLTADHWTAPHRPDCDVIVGGAGKTTLGRDLGRL